MGHLHGGIEGGLIDEQGGVDDGYLVLVGSSRHQRKRGLATHQLYFVVDAVDQEFILQKQYPRGDDPSCRPRDSRLCNLVEPRTRG